MILTQDKNFSEFCKYCNVDCGEDGHHYCWREVIEVDSEMDSVKLFKILQLCQDTEGYMLENIKPWGKEETVINDFIREIYKIHRGEICDKG
jgi:hypothetical protein